MQCLVFEAREARDLRRSERRRVCVDAFKGFLSASVCWSGVVCEVELKEDCVWEVGWGEDEVDHGMGEHSARDE